VAQVAAVAWVQSLAGELLHATGMARNKRRKKKTKNEKSLFSSYNIKSKTPVMEIPVPLSLLDGFSLQITRWEQYLEAFQLHFRQEERKETENTC